MRGYKEWRRWKKSTQPVMGQRFWLFPASCPKRHVSGTIYRPATMIEQICETRWLEYSTERCYFIKSWQRSLGLEIPIRRASTNTRSIREIVINAAIGPANPGHDQSSYWRYNTAHALSNGTFVEKCGGFSGSNAPHHQWNCGQ